MIRPRATWLVYAVPLGWLLAFFLVPLLIVAKVSLSQSVLAQPPYLPTFDLGDVVAGWKAFADKLASFSALSYLGLVEDPIYLMAFVTSFVTAMVATIVTFCVAFPIALAIARAPPRRRSMFLLLAIAPFWTSFLVRIYAWILILKDEGLLNAALLATGIIGAPLHIFATNGAVLIGIVYAYLPFMVLPIYAALDRQDPALREAAADLGAGPLASFFKVTLPLTRAGIAAGCAIVFIPAMGEFVIPDLLGGSDTVMVGNTIWADFFANRDWPTASATAIVLVLVLVGPLMLFEHVQKARA